MSEIICLPVGQHDRWEDSYRAMVYRSFEELVGDFEAYCLSPLARWNWPVWVEYDEENEQGYDCGSTVTIGVFLPRHGRSSQWIAPATPEQVQQIREMILAVWAGRADIGFRRYYST